MQAKELDVIETKDGRRGTILGVYDAGAAFLVEIADQDGKTLDISVIKADDIASVIWKNQN